MKKKLIENVKPLCLPNAYKADWGTTAQTVKDGSDEILILNVYKSRKLLGRHCLNVRSGEYATWLNGKPGTKSPYPMVATDPVWTANRIGYLYCEGNAYNAKYSFIYGSKYDAKTRIAGKESEDIVYKLLKLKGRTAKKRFYGKRYRHLPIGGKQ